MATVENDAAPFFRLGQIYLVNAHFRHRVQPLSLPHDTPVRPQQIGVSITMETLQTAEGGEAVQISVGLTTNPEHTDEGALYDFTVEIAAVVDNIDHARFSDPMVIEAVAAMIYPFMRETVANLTGRGRFGIVWLNPFNVRAAVANALQADAKVIAPTKALKGKKPRA